MENSSNGKQLGRHLDGLLFYLLILVIVALLGWLSQRFVHTWDWTHNSRNSLSQTSHELLERLQAPLQIRSFAPENPQLRKQILEVIERYRRHRPDIQFSFVNPALEPTLTRELGIKVSGELVLDYQGQQANLSDLDEASISSTLQRLLKRSDRRIASLVGHGERQLQGKANHDLGSFGARLTDKGYQLQALDLVSNPQIPSNIELLIVASPQTRLLNGERALLKQYIDQGGNILWLSDPQPAQPLNEIFGDLGLQQLPGTIVDASAAELGLEQPTIAVVSQYSRHPVTDGLNQLTLYPASSALFTAENQNWSTTPILRTQSRSWNETGPLKGEISRDAELNEQAGPLALGYAFSREQGDREQRLLVIGDGDFLSNAYLGNAGNLDLGMNLVRWLSEDDNLLSIPVRGARDTQLALPPVAGAIIGIGFLVVLPLVLFSSGTLIWWRRRRR